MMYDVGALERLIFQIFEQYLSLINSEFHTVTVCALLRNMIV